MVDLKVVEGELELVDLGPVIVQILTQLGQSRLQWFPASGESPFIRKKKKSARKKRIFFSRNAVPFTPSSFVKLLKKHRETMLRIRIRMFLGLPDPDPFVRVTDPAPDSALDPAPDLSIIKKKL